MKNKDLDSLQWEVNYQHGGGWLWKHGPELRGGDRHGGGIWALLLLVAIVAAVWAIW